MMRNKFSWMAVILATGFMALTSGCASGGFKLTRQYAGWVNSQNIILRIIIYILTGVVFSITMLIDVVFFNTLDFWEGKISQGTQEFTEGDKHFHVQHRIQEGSGLKESIIRVSEAGELQQVVEIRELVGSQIELVVDGLRKALVEDIYSLPSMTHLDAKGAPLKKTPIWLELSKINSQSVVSR